MLPGENEVDDIKSLRKLTNEQLIERLLHLKVSLYRCYYYIAVPEDSVFKIF